MANMFKVGDKAYFEESWTENIIGGEVVEVGMTDATEKRPSEQFVKIKIEGSRYEKRDQLSSKCYPTREAALVAQQSKNEAICNKYRDSIQSVEDLVKFMYDNNVCGSEEYTNWNARQVAREKAAELLGLNLD